MNKYSINIFWSDEDKGYIAVSPEFPGLSAFGKTPEKAIAEARVALQLFIDTYEEEGLPLPEPNIAQQYSGQTRVRFPKSLHYQLARRAEMDDTSLNTVIIMACQSFLSGEHAVKRYVEDMRRVFNEATLAFSAWNKPRFKEGTVSTEREHIYFPGLDIRSLEKGGN
jgi:predicted RNase H-like HicB family nuclease